jgi:hypothetical protein
MTRLSAAVLLFSVVASVRPLAQANKGGSRDKVAAKPAAEVSLPQQILDLETKRIAAMVAKDMTTLDKLLSDDLSYTHSGGTTDTKTSFLALIKDRGRYTGIDYLNSQVSVWNDATAMVRGVAQIRLEGTEPYAVQFVDVWTFRSGAWKMVAWQATRLPDKAGR